MGLQFFLFLNISCYFLNFFNFVIYFLINYLLFISLKKWFKFLPPPPPSPLLPPPFPLPPPLSSTVWNLVCYLTTTIIPTVSLPRRPSGQKPVFSTALPPSLPHSFFLTFISPSALSIPFSPPFLWKTLERVCYFMKRVQLAASPLLSHSFLWAFDWATNALWVLVMPGSRGATNMCKTNSLNSINQQQEGRSGWRRDMIHHCWYEVDWDEC